jgi:hypothetical protein
MKKILIAVLLCGLLLLGSGCVLGDWLMGTSAQEITLAADAPAPEGAVKVGTTASGSLVYYVPAKKGAVQVVGGGLLGTGQPLLELIGTALVAAGSLYTAYKGGRVVATKDATAATGMLLNSAWESKDEGLSVLKTVGKTNKVAKAVHKKLSKGK